MIKFFRHIRQKLLSENKFSKYLLYAIGEIILVVIGILIALSINNWNENLKLDKEEITILENLNKNLILAKNQSDSLISYEKRLIKDIITVINYESNNLLINKDSIGIITFKNALWNLDSHLLVVNAYEDLKNTNKLELIKNQGLKEKFTSLEINLIELKIMLDDRLNFQQIRVDNIAENDINFIPFLKSSFPTIDISNEKSNDYSKILSNRRIRNLLGIKLFMTKDILISKENLGREIKDLISLIEMEVKEKNN
ncbi:hypothetical protein H8K90_16045 [Winogradskyella echinorum]|uniref:Uncharacterized protein n=1 Tax=Winogradskyella echinorum TaxID=538189 RepID=A0ABR6Y6M8_9FLAO|nr:DUF6090 family protein [Winogradskyella echinorum]MBC3847908.1 hypothetical protein [Winogradskyella echinorum]MBC5752256.1 hypothetical protein [Winogradskyella echinorum]